MSERIHSSERARLRSGNKLKTIAAASALTIASLMSSSCDVDSGNGLFTCYVPSAGGINGSGKATAIGTKPRPNHDVAANLTLYYKNRAFDDNGNGRISYEEVKNAARRDPLAVEIEGIDGIRYIKDTGGDFKNAGPGRMDISMFTLNECTSFGKRNLAYRVFDPTPPITPSEIPSI